VKIYHIIVLTVVLGVAAAMLFVYKAVFLNFPLTSDQQSTVWTVEAHVSFNARNRPVKVSLFIPKSTERLSIMDENFISRGFGLATHSREGNRAALWSVRRAVGHNGLYYRAIVREGSLPTDTDKTVLAGEDEEALEGARLEAVRALLSDIQAKSADTDSFVAALIKSLNRPESDSSVKLLVGRSPTDLSRAQAAVRVLREAGQKARIVHGVSLSEPGRNVPLVQRLEVYENKAWKSYDLKNGRSGVPDDFLAWWRGDAPLATVEGGDRIRTLISVDRYQEDAVTNALAGVQQARPMLLELSLFSLPLETQRLYRILLLVPIGALLIVIFRNVIGLSTFGTFMPVLIALAFRETELVWGIILFVILSGLGVAARFYLERLKLLLVPRLGAILTIVVILMAVLSIITHKLGLERGLSLALFPMVIVTMTIERMSIVWDELGSHAALKQLFGSLLAASLVYLVIRQKELQHLIFVFPELLLVVLAIIIWLGRYTGYRLTELFRFKAVAQTETGS
jgi:hypothetical protein